MLGSITHLVSGGSKELGAITEEKQEQWKGGEYEDAGMVCKG